MNESAIKTHSPQITIGITRYPNEKVMYFMLEIYNSYGPKTKNVNANANDERAGMSRILNFLLSVKSARNLSANEGPRTVAQASVPLSPIREFFCFFLHIDFAFLEILHYLPLTDTKPHGGIRYSQLYHNVNSM